MMARRWVLFSVVSVTLFMSSVDSTTVAVTLPALQRGLHASLGWAAWVLTVYQLGFALAQPLVGRLSDQFGRRRVYLTCVCLFGAGSGLCGLAPNIHALIALRFLEAIGGGGILPSATGAIADGFGTDRSRAIGLFSSILPAGSIAGPLIGGIILNATGSWRVVFFMNVAITLVVFPVLLKIVPSSVGRPTQTDFTGAALFGVSILLFMISVTALGQNGQPIDLLPLAAAALTAILLWRHIHAVSSPIIPPHLLRTRPLAAANLINIAYGATSIGSAALTPLYLHSRYGLTALQSGVLLSYRAAAMLLVAAVAANALRYTGYRLPFFIGFTLMAAGLLASALEPPPAVSATAWLSAASIVLGIGLGLASPAASNVSLSLAPDDIATMSGIRSMFRQVGAILLIAGTTAAVEHSGGRPTAYSASFCVLVAIMMAALPLIGLLPAHDSRPGDDETSPQLPVSAHNRGSPSRQWWAIGPGTPAWPWTGR